MFNLDSLTLFDRVEQATDLADANIRFQALLADNGFSEGFYLPDVPMESRRALVDHRDDMHLFGSHVSGSFFPSIAERMRPFAKDPITAALRKSARPWIKNAEFECKTKGLGYFADITLDHGLSAAALFPIHGTGRAYSIYGLYTPRETPETYRTLRDHLADLNLAILHFHGTCRAKFAETGAQASVCLAPRERECLTWAAAGLKSKQIAHRLDLSIHTVNEAIGNAMRKLGASSRAEAVAKAIVARLIEP